MKRRARTSEPKTAPPPEPEAAPTPKKKGRGRPPKTKQTAQKGSVAPAATVSQTNCEWAQCDTCQKWRKVSQAPTTKQWFCNRNPDERYNNCSAAQVLASRLSLVSPLSAPVLPLPPNPAPDSQGSLLC